MIKKIIDNQNLTISLHSLIKTNNGLWKSEKQKQFFITQLNNSDLDGSQHRIACNQDIGIVVSSDQKWFFVLNDKGISKRYYSKMKWIKRTYKNYDEAQKAYYRMSFKQREQNSGLIHEDILQNISGYKNCLILNWKTK